MFLLENIVRPNIKNLKPYSSARDEFKGSASVFLDANENSFGSPLPQAFNRYPDPLQHELKDAISHIKGCPSQNIFLGNGSDEAIDLLYRIFCEPGAESVIICPPTYGMYEVCAHINEVEIRKVNLLPNFELDVPGILEQAENRTKLLFLCSPNNPTGNSMHPEDMELLVQKFPGIVVIDEAYINYSSQLSCIKLLTEHPNLVILQTFSKAWGLAALRLGMTFASQAIIDFMNKVKPPYNINQATQQLVLQALANVDWVNGHIKTTIKERESLTLALKGFPYVEKIFPSDANFLLLRVSNPDKLYNMLMERGIIVRNRNKISLCEGCLRITVGTPEQNKLLIETLQQISL